MSNSQYDSMNLRLEEVHCLIRSTRMSAPPEAEGEREALQAAEARIEDCIRCANLGHDQAFQRQQRQVQDALRRIELGLATGEDAEILRSAIK